MQGRKKVSERMQPSLPVMPDLKSQTTSTIAHLRLTISYLIPAESSLDGGTGMLTFLSHHTMALVWRWIYDSPGRRLTEEWNVLRWIQPCRLFILACSKLASSQGSIELKLKFSRIYLRLPLPTSNPPMGARFDVVMCCLGFDLSKCEQLNSQRSKGLDDMRPSMRKGLNRLSRSMISRGAWASPFRPFAWMS